MAPPRFTGYGFRNIGGWEKRDNCARAGRNLNFASAGVLLYQISGASIGGISYGGASLPASHPDTFSMFALIGFLWLAYRFLLAYRSAKDSDRWWHMYMRDIVLDRYPISKYASDVLTERFAPKRQSFSMGWKSSMKNWSTLVVPEVKLNNQVVATDVEIEIPFMQMVRAHLFVFPRYIISNTDIADMIVPWVLFGLACASLLLESFGVDPAGLFGLITPDPG